MILMIALKEHTLRLFKQHTNQLERQQNQRQVIQKQQARLRNGYWAFRAPLGYKKIRNDLHGTIDYTN